MIKIPAILFMVFLSLAGNAQRLIKGIVVNEATGVPIAGSSIFITNTSKGTVSDASGQFILNDVPAGKHELVISSIGYETIVHPFSDVNLPLQLRVQLKIKVKELANVTVEPFVEEGWDKWGKIFMENFIGYTENASRCKIKNEEAIRFRYYKKSRRLVAYCDEPIKIENKALGYTISYQLEDFEIDYSKNTTLFLGYSLYEEPDRDKKKWQRKRETAFNGSMMHFIRSLYADSLKENGFEIRRMVKLPNTEKQRVKAIYKPVQTMSFGGGMTVTTQTGTGGVHPDSATYYRNVLRQPDFIEQYGKDLLTADSVILQKDGEHKLLYFTDYLYITYKNELEAEGYLKSQMQSNRKPTFQRSFLFFPESIPVWIEKNGSYYNPRDLYSMGYWGWSDKLGDSVPLDYEPGK
jgi:hypothetical protein